MRQQGKTYKEMKLKPGKSRNNQLPKFRMVMTSYTVVQRSRMIADSNSKLTGVNKHVIAEKRPISYLEV